MLSGNDEKMGVCGLLRVSVVSIFAFILLPVAAAVPRPNSRRQSTITPQAGSCCLKRRRNQSTSSSLSDNLQFDSALTSTWSRGWNQTLEQALSDQVIIPQTTSKVSVFTKAGVNVYAPYYQQC